MTCRRQEARGRGELRDGEPGLLRFVGKTIGGGFGISVYLTDDGAVLVVLEEDFLTFDSADEFTDWVHSNERNVLPRDEEEALGDAATALGARRVIDI